MFPMSCRWFDPVDIRIVGIGNCGIPNVPCMDYITVGFGCKVFLMTSRTYI